MAFTRLAQLLRRFRRDTRGNIALLAALLAVPIVGTVGLGVDYLRQQGARQALSNAALQASSQAIGKIRDNYHYYGFHDANSASAAWVLQWIQNDAKSYMGQDFTNAVALIPDVTVTQLTSSSSVDASGTNLTFTLNYKATIKTTFAQLLGVSTLTVGDSVTQVGDFGTSNPSGDLISESFETSLVSSPYNYSTYANYNGWTTQPSACHGVEIGLGSHYGVTAPDGSNIAELDSYCNSSMSKSVYLTTGAYEVRYFYSARKAIANYNPVWLCSWQSSDLDYMYPATGDDTNRVGVYLDAASGSSPPTYPLSPTTNNLIDVCMNTAQGKWVERSIKLNITTAGTYWLTFQAEGQSDSFGGFIDNIRLCRTVCGGLPADPFPWAQGTVLYQDFGNNISNWNCNNIAAGTNGTNNGWTQMAAPGWVVAPINDSECGTAPSPTTGTVEMGAWVSPSGRTYAKKFLLANGYYQLSYGYQSRVTNTAGTFCGYSTVADAQAAVGVGTVNEGNVTGLYIDNDILQKHPVNTSTATYAGVSYVTVDGTANGPGNAWWWYANLPQRLFDICASSSSLVTRTVPFQVVKPGWYWISFRNDSSTAATSGYGGHISNVTLTAMGGRGMNNPPNGGNVPWAQFTWVYQGYTMSFPGFNFVPIAP